MQLCLCIPVYQNNREQKFFTFKSNVIDNKLFDYFERAVHWINTTIRTNLMERTRSRTIVCLWHLQRWELSDKPVGFPLESAAKTHVVLRVVMCVMSQSFVYFESYFVQAHESRQSKEIHLIFECDALSIRISVHSLMIIAIMILCVFICSGEFELVRRTHSSLDNSVVCVFVLFAFISFACHCANKIDSLQCTRLLNCVCN